MATGDEQLDEMQERIDEVGNQIHEARQQAEDDNVLFDPDEPRYYESGEIGEEDDDQTIAPG